MAGRDRVKITADTNVLVRAAVAADDPASEDGRQSRQAIALLRDAELIAVTIPTLCEFVWVLRRSYGHPAGDIARTIRALCGSAAVVCERRIVEAGLQWLENGGDFAAGVIAALGEGLGADLFVSFDAQAVRLARAAGIRATLAAD